MAELSSFGAWLRQLRKGLDLTQDEMAERIGYQGDTIRKIECGVRRPSKQVAALLAGFLHIPDEQRADFVHFARFSDGREHLSEYPHRWPVLFQRTEYAKGEGELGTASLSPARPPFSNVVREDASGTSADGIGAEDGDGDDQAGGKWGSSLAILIPGEIAEELHWDQHTAIEPKIAGNKLVIEAVQTKDTCSGVVV